jgi:5'-nucleotidase
VATVVRMRILVTNDDGIDSTGLHELVRAVSRHGDVIVVAPDSEYSGASASVGALHLIHPEVRRTTVECAAEAFTVSGPPALCVLFARMGVFGALPDLVVSGINPGANVGRAVYHSGTVGAALTARNGNITGIAISQEVTGFGIEGQGWDDMLAGQLWSTAAEVADRVVGAVCASMPEKALVLNVNVPNLPLDELKGWRYSEVGMTVPRSIRRAQLEPRPGHDGSFWVKMEYGDSVTLPEDEDGGAVEAGYVALTWLSRFRQEMAAGFDDASVRGAMDAIAGPQVL